MVQSLATGSVLGGRYTVVHALAGSGEAQAYAATDTSLNRRVTVVAVPDDSPQAPAVLDAAHRAAVVDHPGLVHILDVGRDSGVAYFVEESLAGAATLTQLVGRTGLAAEEIRRITGEVATALDAGRRRGLHHLGLTPDNVVRMPDGSIRVAGLATQAALAGQDHIGGERALRRDAKSLVALAYAGLTGRWPLAGDVGLEPAPRMVTGVARPSEIAVGVPVDLDTICGQTLNDDLGPVSPADYAAQIAPWARMRVGRIGDPGGEVSPVPAGGSGATPTSATQPINVTPAHTWPATAPSATSAPTVTSPEVPPATTATTEGTQPRAQLDTQVIVIDSGARAAAPVEASTAEATQAIETGAIAAASTTDTDTDTTAAATVAATGTAGATGDAAGAKVGSALSAASAAATGVFGKISGAVSGATRAITTRTEAAVSGRGGASPADGEDAAYESPAPLLPAEAGAPPSPTQSRFVLLMFLGLMGIALMLGVAGASRIGSNTDLNAILGSDSTAPATEPDRSSTSAATSENPATGSPLAIAGAVGYDPEGDQTENNALAPRVYDEDPATSWQTEGYQGLKFGGLKSGVGLVLDLGQPVKPRTVTLELPTKSSFQLFVGDEPDRAAANEIGGKTNTSGTVTIQATGNAGGRYLIVWFTDAPQVADGRYRATLAEIAVSG